MGSLFFLDPSGTDATDSDLDSKSAHNLLSQGAGKIDCNLRNKDHLFPEMANNWVFPFFGTLDILVQFKLKCFLFFLIQKVCHH